MLSLLISRSLSLPLSLHLPHRLSLSICLSGSGKVEPVRAVDVLTVLREKVAFVSGNHRLPQRPCELHLQSDCYNLLLPPPAFSPSFFQLRWARQEGRAHPDLPRPHQPRSNKAGGPEPPGHLPVGHPKRGCARPRLHGGGGHAWQQVGQCQASAAHAAGVILGQHPHRAANKARHLLAEAQDQPGQRQAQLRGIAALQPHLTPLYYGHCILHLHRAGVNNWKKLKNLSR